MYTHQFPLCCGAYCLTDFGYTSTSGGTRSTIDKEDIRKYIQDAKDYYKSVGFLMAILNNTQMEHIGHIFLEEGFQVVSQGWNAGHPQTQPLSLLVLARGKKR